jgi:hypothetical protein
MRGSIAAVLSLLPVAVVVLLLDDYGGWFVVNAVKVGASFFYRRRCTSCRSS